MTYPPTIIVRHPEGEPAQMLGDAAQGRADVVFVNYPARTLPSLEGYIRLAAEGPELSASDSTCGVLLLDGSWRWSEAMEKSFQQVPPRALHGWRTAYPRISKLGTDPDNGLASIEALYLAHHILGRPTAGLLDSYRWAEAFLRANALS